MVTIPLYFILFGYLFFLFVTLLFFGFNTANLIRTGTFTLLSFWATFWFLGLSVLTVWVTWYLLQTTVWETPLTIWDNAWFPKLLEKIFTVTL